MQKQIWKYKIQLRLNTVQIPVGGIVRHVDSQDGSICIWIEVEPGMPLEDRIFETFGTGHGIQYDMGVDREFLGSLKMQDGLLIFHVYERI